jgi:pimeloyl-ACP methyl ester carboxylesterase
MEYGKSSYWLIIKDLQTAQCASEDAQSMASQLHDLSCSRRRWRTLFPLSPNDPKLLFVGNPGALISPAFAESFAKGLKDCRVVRLSSGLHFLQEDHPDVVGANVKEWLIELGIGSSAKQKLTL